MEAAEQASAPKKPRLVFTDLQRRTLQAIFKVPPTPALVPWYLGSAYLVSSLLDTLGTAHLLTKMFSKHYL